MTAAFPTVGATGWAPGLQSYIDEGSLRGGVTLAAATTDDTSAINTALASGAKVVRGRPGQNYQISSPIIVKSGTVLDMTGCTVTLKAGNTCNMVTNYSAANVVATASDGAVTSGSNVVTTSLGATAVVGQTLWVAGAAGNGNGPLIGNITARTSTTITISKLNGDVNNASATVSAAAVRLYNRDSNITIKGGTWDRGANGPDSGGSPMAGIIGHSFFLAHIDGLKVDLDNIQSTHGITFVWITDASSFEATIRGGNVVRTALQVVGPIYNGRIPYVHASSTDDLLNICGNVYSDQTDTCGDVRTVTVGTVHADVVTGSAFKINAGQGFTIDDISTRQISGTAVYGGWIGEDTSQAATTGGNYGTINFGHIDVITTTGRALALASPTIRHLIASVVVRTSFRGVSVTGGNANVVDLFDLTLDVTGAVAPALEFQGAVVVNTMRVTGRIDSSATGATVAYGAASSTQNVKSLVFDNIRATYSASPAQLFSPAANSQTFGTVSFYNCFATFASNANGLNSLCYLTFSVTGNEVKVFGGRIESGGNAVRLDTTVTAVQAVHVGGGLHMYNCDRVGVLAKTTSLYLGQIIHDTGVSPAFAFTAGAGIVYRVIGGSITGNLGTPVTFMSRGSTELVRVFSPELSMDLSKVSKVASTFAINDNGALSCGTGPVICDGTNWKHLFTGSTYVAPQ